MECMDLTARQRNIILRVAVVQRGDLLSCELWDDIKTKVAISEEESQKLFKKLSDEQVLVDLQLYDGEVQTYNFEKQERRVLADALRQYKGYEPGEPQWVRKMISELENTT